MNRCEAVRSILVDVARGAPADLTLQKHLESCAGCRRRVANERMLSAGLVAISSVDTPPPAVRAAIMAEFRRTYRATPIRRSIAKWVALAAAAALVLLAVFLGTRPRRPEKIVTAVASQVEAPARVAPAVPRVAAQPRKPAKRRRVVRVQAPPPPEETPEVATDFVAIPYSEPLRPEERVDMFRMEMPRANMAVFGLPVTGGHLDSRVTADVLIGEDGVMRAIRFVR